MENGRLASVLCVRRASGSFDMSLDMFPELDTILRYYQNDSRGG
jgi:hypothetical protein